MKMKTKKHDVFISYSTRNKKKAEIIRDYLEEKGIRCWFAPTEVHCEDVFSKKITEAIKSSKAFILLVSKASQQSDWVNEELSVAKHYHIPIYGLFLEKVDLEGDFELVLLRKHHYELANAKTRDAILGRLHSDLYNKHKIGDDPSIDPDQAPSPDKKKTNIKRIAFVLSAAILVVAICISLFFIFGNSRDGNYVIWNPKYSVALSGEAINTHYHAGEAVKYNGDKLNGYSENCVWYVEFDKDGYFTLSRNGKNLGTEVGHNGIGLDSKYDSDKWELVEADGGLCYIRNVASGKCLEWYVEKDNWSTHDNITDKNRDYYLVYFDKVK